MTQRTSLYLAIPLAGALLLTACGGGSDPVPVKAADPVVPTPTPTPTPDPIPNPTPEPASVTVPGVAEPDPSASGVFITPFVQRARQSTCGQYYNRLFVVDHKYVFAGQNGSCDVNTDREVLFGSTPDVRLCTSYYGRLGGKESCADPMLTGLFEKLWGMQTSPKLLPAGTKTEEIFFLPMDGSRLALTPLAQDNASGIKEPRHLVIRDAATLAAVWAEHTNGGASPAARPVVHFENEMAIAVFAGSRGGSCGEFGIRAVRVSGDKLVAEYEHRSGPPGIACPQIVTTPMQIVMVDRSYASVTFDKVAPLRVAFKPIEGARKSQMHERTQLVIKDAQGWAALWKRHDGVTPPPDVDFGKHMVLFATTGARPVEAYKLAVSDVERIGGKLRVTTVEKTMGRYSMGPAPAAITNAWAAAVVERSDEPVEFVEQLSYYR
ncbi:hypothetical protein CR152_31625 [Massilia violaceinigra]|uniref:Uncharacterized protein n=1 Tax=Massilia violaceinigra TaxID=2045208 RepID=A0A2D2DUA8_9BURK|nr:hypothetical protein [Massilia violaceinigra]ATQ78561.1 hypothetical protein CR152_31625 [Massilia violaceinigra]